MWQRFLDRKLGDWPMRDMLIVLLAFGRRILELWLASAVAVPNRRRPGPHQPSVLGGLPIGGVCGRRSDRARGRGRRVAHDHLVGYDPAPAGKATRTNSRLSDPTILVVYIFILRDGNRPRILRPYRCREELAPLRPALQLSHSVPM
jgi:hypothetical protein